MKSRINISVLFLLCFVVALSGKSFAGVPIGKSDLTYLGAFRVPQGTQGVESFSGNPYSAAQYQVFTYNPANNSILLSNTPLTTTSTMAVGEISIPSLVNPVDVGYDVSQLNTATVLQSLADPSGGTFNQIGAGGATPSDEAKAFMGGLYVYDNKLFGTVWGYYDASAANSVRSHWTANLDWSSGYGFDGIHTVGTSPTGSTANGGFVGGSMVEIPDEYKTALGYDILTGRSGGPIVSRSSYGPTFWGFDPDTFNYDNPADAEMFIGYPDSHQTLGSYNDTPSEYYTRGTSVQSIIWPEGSDSVFAFGMHGLGVEHDTNGLPIAASGGSCTGPGTSNRDEAHNNAWLVSNSPNGYECGYTYLSASDIAGGSSCCFDPEDPSNTTHNLPYSVGYGQSCYGPGTDDWSEARRNDWLVANSPGGYTCGSHGMSASDIAAGNGCCYRGAGPQDKGGNAYPSVYQVWQYDVDDLIAVKNGTQDPWDVIPTVWNLDLPLDPSPADHTKNIIGATYDETNKILYVGQSFGDGNYPLIHAFEITTLLSEQVSSTTIYYLDVDGDGFYNGSTQSVTSDPGDNWYLAGELNSTAIVDCNDSDASIYQDCDSIANVASLADLYAAFDGEKDGDEIIIAPGTYTLNSTALSVEADNLIIRSSTGNRDDVVIQGDAMSSSASIKSIFYFPQGASGQNTTIKDLTIGRVGWHAIMFNGNGSGNGTIIDNVKIFNTYEQMLKANVVTTATSNVTIKNSLFEFTIPPLNYYTGGIDAHSADGWVIQNNVFKNIQSPSSYVAEHAIHLWENDSFSGSNLIEKNKIFNCDRGIGIWNGTGETIIRNNMITSLGTGVFNDVGIDIQNTSNTQIYNNSIWIDDTAYYAAIELRGSMSTGSYVVNNLSNKVINQFNGAVGTLLNNTTDVQETSFVGIESGDLHIKVRGDTGLSVSGLVDDFDGQVRTGSIDIGADQLNSNILPPSTLTIQ